MLLQESILEIELSVRECIAKLSEMNYSDLTDGEVDASEDAGLMPESVHDRAVGLGLGLLLGHFGHVSGSWSHCRGDGGVLPQVHAVGVGVVARIHCRKKTRGEDTVLFFFVKSGGYCFQYEVALALPTAREWSLHLCV